MQLKEIKNKKSGDKSYSQSIINQDLCIDCKTCINDFQYPVDGIAEIS